MAGKNARPGEFELIERYFRPLARAPGAFSLLDDAALIRPPPGADLVITADIVAENVHFFADDPASSIARKALSVNLSDLAGKGAEPAAYLLSIALREDFTEAWIAAFASGLREEQERYGVSLIGGDTTRAAGGTTVAITAIGSLSEGTMVHRSGARPGDLVFVSGTIGDGALGLLLRLGKLDPATVGGGAPHLLDRYLHPQPRVALAPVIRRFATSAMDVSDGLVGDLAHICRASAVGADIGAAAVPLSGAAQAAIEADPALLVAALTGGDDYEILATIPEKDADAFVAASAGVGVPVTSIGRIIQGAAPPKVIDARGAEMPLGKRSFDHFSNRA